MTSTYISQFYILSLRGDTLIARDYRADISRESAQIFFRKAVSYNHEVPPCFTVNGIHFFTTKKNKLYFVCTSRVNVPPNFVLEFQSRLCRLCQDYLGILNEESVRKNYTLLYELLDEVIDYGYPQHTSTQGLKLFVFNDPNEVEDEEYGTTFLEQLTQSVTNFLPVTFQITEKKTIESNATRRPVQTTTAAKNEIFVDILETLHVVFNSKGTVLSSEIIGSITMKSFLLGNPHLRMGLNEDLELGMKRKQPGKVVLDQYSFAPFVNVDEFLKLRIISLDPKDGEFTVMSYKIRDAYKFPFRIFPFIKKQGQYKIECVVKVRCDIPKVSNAINVLIKIPVPKETGTVFVDFGVGSTANVYEYRQSEHSVYWGIKKFPGSSEQVCRIRLALNKEIFGDVRKHIGPISMKFELPMHNVSGLQVRFLKLEERSRAYNPNRWVRYITSGGSYVCRTTE